MAEPQKTYEKSLDLIRRYLWLPNSDPFEFVWAVAAANQLDGLPLWGGLVAPSGDAKSAILMSLQDSDTDLKGRFVFRSSITEHTLISGLKAEDAHKGEEPSLLPKLHNKILVMKDFTVVIGMKAAIRNAVLGQLRDCFDGSFAQSYGTGESKSFNAKFGVLIGVTGMIEDVWASQNGLGERFIYCRDMPTAAEEIQKMEAAQRHTENAAERDKSLRKASFAVTHLPVKRGIQVPWIESKRLVALARFVARARSQVKRRGKSTIMLRPPEAEMGTRLVQQIELLGKGLCSVREQDTWDADITEFCCRVVPSSVPLARWQVLMAMGVRTGNTTTQMIGIKAGMNEDTAKWACEELEALQLLRSNVEHGHQVWRMTDLCRELIEGADLSRVLDHATPSWSRPAEKIVSTPIADDGDRLSAALAAATETTP